MTTTLETPVTDRPVVDTSDSNPNGTSDSALPDATHLEDRMPDWLKSPRWLAGFTAALGFVFVFFSYRPVWHTDIWGHLAYGRFLWASGHLPATEPLMPLAKGMPFVDTAWLSQIVGFQMHHLFGVPGLQFLYAASIVLCAGLLVGRLHVRTRSVRWSLAGMAVFLWINWQQFLVIRPQLAGLVCFVALLALLTARTRQPREWILVPLLFALWANLHGSFPVGLAMLGAFGLGRAADVLRRTGTVRSLWRDRDFRRYCLLLELAAAAVLLNPYGFGLYKQVLLFSGNANLQALTEWDPLTLTMRQGRTFAIVSVALMFLYRLTPRRITGAEVLLLLGTGAAALWASRMIVWWGPVAAYFVALHGHAVLRRFRGKRTEPGPSPRNGTWAVVSLGLAWICFAYTPFGTTLLHGRQPELERSVSKGTPLGATAYLRKHPPRGLVFNTYEWGDYLLWAGPQQMQVFVATHVQFLPEKVWQHYLEVINVTAEWEDVLDRYGVNTVVIDTAERAALISLLRRNPHWRLAYGDRQGVVYIRKKPI